MIRKLLAFGTLALAACLASVPCTAAPPSHVFSVTARSGELCPSFDATAVDHATAATVADRTPINRASSGAVAPRLYAATLFFVGADTSPGAPAPFDPGRLRIA